ncbi:hypothetical protein CRUP_019261 [Coryphaenoides rupestris]|nr:hypothetical protein CRUP_019261 [Coryphaenoides rupestris]
MTQGRAGSDFTCKSLRGHTGRVVGLVYLEGTAAQSSDVCSANTTICTASTDGTLRAWDVQKVIYAESLAAEEEEEGDPLCQCLPVTECQASVFVPGHPARLAVVHPPAGGGGRRSGDRALTVLDVSLKKSKYKASDEILLEASRDSSTLVVAAGLDLWLCSLQGVCLASFQNHTEPISSISVDGDKGSSLENRYHLLGGSHTMSRGFTHVACDYSSIVASTEGRDGKDVLKVYTFTS